MVTKRGTKVIHEQILKDQIQPQTLVEQGQRSAELKSLLVRLVLEIRFQFMGIFSPWSPSRCLIQSFTSPSVLHL